MVVQESNIIQEFKNYYISRESAIIGHFVNASDNGNENALHELRVEIKKIRAFFGLINGITPYFDLKRAYRPMRNLFKTAAPMRDSQVLQTMTREYISAVGLNVNLSEYFNYLKKKEMEGKRDFLRFCKKFDLSVLRKNWSSTESALLALDENKIRESSMEYLKALFHILDDLKSKSDYENNTEAKSSEAKNFEIDNEIAVSKGIQRSKPQKLLKANLELEEKYFHDIRILCKKTRYTLEILTSFFSEESFESINKCLKNIHQPLGEWHDTDAAIALINEILSDQTLKPLFSESSYYDMLQSFKVRKQHFNDLFITSFKKLDLVNMICSPNNLIE